MGKEYWNKGITNGNSGMKVTEAIEME